MNAIFMTIFSFIIIVIIINKLKPTNEKIEESEYLNMPKITVYSANKCIKCKMTKKFLQQNNVDYLEINIDDEEFNLKEYGKTRDDYVKYIKDELLLSTMPIVVTENDYWGDYQLGKLKELVKQIKG
jgi:putative glutaredoxin